MPTNLTSIDRVKRYCKLALDYNKDDDLLNELLAAVSEEFRQFCQQDFDLALFDEVYHGSGNRFLQISRFPVQSVRSLTVNGSPFQESPDVGFRPGYTIGDRALVNSLGYWPDGFANIRISYVAGYESVPEDVQQAAAYLVTLRYKKRESVGLTSKSSGAGGSDTFDTIDWPESITATMSQYVEPDLVLPFSSRKTAPPPSL